MHGVRIIVDDYLVMYINKEDTIWLTKVMIDKFYGSIVTILKLHDLTLKCFMKWFKFGKGLSTSKLSWFKVKL